VTFSHSTTAGSVDTADGTQTVQITNIGNEELQFSGLSYPADFAAGSTSNACTSSSTIAINGACNVGIEFYPQNGGSLSESVTLIDNAQNLAQSITANGTAAGTAPSITSGSTTTFTAGSAGSFTVTASGSPSPTFSEIGTLPSGVTFSSGGVLSGTPAAGTGGTYSLSFTAANGVGSNAVQSFTLKVNQAPSITSANSTTFTEGTSGSFTVTSSAYPSATFSETGALPTGVTFSSAGILSGTPTGASGTYPITITAANGISPNATQSFTLTVNAGPATHLVIPGGPEPFYTAFGFTISAYDAEGNLATSYNGTVAFTSSDPGFVNLGPITLVNGVGSQTAVLKTAGVDSITATDTTNPSITGTGYFTVQPGVATRIGLVAPSSAYVGSPISYTLTAYDLYGNVATSYGGTVVFTSSDPSAVLPGSSTITNGTGTFSATMETVGSQTITATDAGNSLTAQTGNIGVTLPVLVVTTAVDDPGATSNCTIQATPATGTDAACSLRDALLFAANQGSGSITFDSTAFAPTNTTAANTITLSNGVLSIPSNTSIWGATSGSGAKLTNLVTVNGNQASTDFYVDYGVTSTSINNLIVTGGNCDENTGFAGGGIDNEGTLTVAGSTISGNLARDGLFGTAGGGIYNEGTLTVTNSTISENSAGRLGGGIDSGGTLTVTNSTISGNSSEDGGGIFGSGASATVTVTNSTISANSASDGPNAGGGIINENGVTNLANTIVAANSGGDVSSTYTDNGGNQVSTGVTLSVLGGYGGPTQTMLPMPGSAAICGATSANSTAAGITLDQRGFLFDPRCPTGSVDSGAVESNYGLGFGNVPHTTVAGQVITPAPTTTLYESGVISTAPTSAVTLSDASSTLSGTTTENLSSGVATFPSVSFTAVGLNTQLIATMALNASVNLVATAGTTTTVSPVPAVLAAPSPGTTLPGPVDTFSWSPVTGATAYSLWIGTTGPGSHDLYTSGAQTVTSVKVADLPTNGATVYVRLYTIFDGVATPNDYTFTASTRAAITAPSSPSTFTSPNVTFSWSPATGAVGYSLWLGSTGVGSFNLYDSGTTTALTATANALPTNGETIYARLYTIYPGGISVSTDSTYTAVSGAMAMLTTPTPSTTLAGSKVTFTWSAGLGATGYSLWIGSTGPGSDNLYVSHETTALTATATGLPTNSSTVYVRLYSIYNGSSKYTDYTYTAAP